MTSVAESVQIENVVASGDVDQELALKALARDLESANYEPENAPGLIYRISELETSALIFRSGKVVCTGAKSIGDVRAAIRHVFTRLRELGIDVSKSPDIEVQNIVSSADLEQTLNLNAIAIGLGLEDAEYEPEQFPGLVYRLDDPSVVVLLFGSGKLVITGGNQLSDVERALETIEDRLEVLGVLT